MDTAAAPVSLKGTREPLLLIATGLFLCAFWLPITCLLGCAGIALGMHDLRKSEAATTLGKLRLVLALASWCCCVFWATSCFWQVMFVPQFVLHTLTPCGTGIALHRLASMDGASGLARAFFALAWIPLTFVPLLFAAPPVIATLVYMPAMMALAVLGLRLHARAAPYGKRRARPAA